MQLQRWNHDGLIKKNGFTFVELLVVLALLTILLVLGGPAFMRLFDQNRISTYLHHTEMMIDRAYDLARYQNESVNVLFESDEQAACVALKRPDDNCGCLPSSETKCEFQGDHRSIVEPNFSQRVIIVQNGMEFNTVTGQAEFVAGSAGIKDPIEIKLQAHDITAGININEVGSIFICSNNLGKYPNCDD